MNSFNLFSGDVFGSYKLGTLWIFDQQRNNQNHFDQFLKCFNARFFQIELWFFGLQKIMDRPDLKLDYLSIFLTCREAIGEYWVRDNLESHFLAVHIQNVHIVSLAKRISRALLTWVSKTARRATECIEGTQKKAAGYCDKKYRGE